MATTARQPKPQRKGMPESAARRPSAWSGPRASPTFSPGQPNSRLPPTSPGAFPPLGHSPSPAPNGAGTPTPPPRTDKEAPHERILAQLSGLTGTTITLSTKTHARYEGVIGSTTSAEGDTIGVTLLKAKDLTRPNEPTKDPLFVAATNIEQWSSGPADASVGAGVAENGANGINGDSFKTDTDISKTNMLRRERELQAWQPSDDASAAPAASTSPPPGSTTATNASANANANANGGARDEQTFGPLAGGAGGWDQFAANERLFGVTGGFDEDVYTTKLDRNAPDFKERERRAAAIANEIMQSTANNVHVAEERTQNFVGDSTNEEDRYGAVVRSANAYVPPGARKTNSASPAQVPGKPEGKTDVPKVAVNAPDGSSAPAEIKPKAGSPAPGGNKPAADAVPAFREFVSSERDRLMKKKQALMKNEMDKRVAELVKFSQSFKLNKPIPDDLVPILAKDEEKQRQIREKSTKDAESSHARSIGISTTTVAAPTVARTPPAFTSNPPASAKPPSAQPAAVKAAATGTQKTSAQSKSAEAKGRLSMFIQPIPPFKGSKRMSSVPQSGAAATSGAGGRTQSGVVAASGATSPLSPTAAANNRLNVNASSFRPTVKSVSPPAVSPNLNGTSSSTASPKPKAADSAASPQTQGPPNPFFGTRVIKKGPLVHIKDDFNPFKYHKVVDAAQVAPTWPFNGKRYMQMFPPLQAQPQPQSPPMAHPLPPPIPPPSYEEDSAAQAAARGQYVYAYPQYGYPGQPMMPGMGPPPHGAYMHPPFMQPMPYPHMPPNGMYPAPGMGQMPPPQAYMQPPPPGAYPTPPNGAGPRPSMPPTPIPSHAHPYYHQSPQLQHAMPYPMMMPPPGPPPHPYDGSQAPPVPMGGVGHA